MDTLLPEATPDGTSTDDTVAEEQVVRVRINYHSGAFIESWFKTFDATTTKTGEIFSIRWELPEVAPESEGKLNRPIELGIPNIESVWIVDRMSASELYSKSMNL